MNLVLPPRLRAGIEEEAHASFPRECCGLIEGVRAGDMAQAFTLHPARNIAERPDRFEIEPEDHFKALKAARKNDRAVIGCYHSHPGGEAKPSAEDLAGAGEDGFIWLIASLPASHAPVTLAAFVYSASAFFCAGLTSLSRESGSAVGADLVTSSGKARS